jgi:CheY-like chemotaxis protein
MNILVVDDSEDTRLLLSALLMENEHKVASAPNGQVALDMLKDSLPDLIITDILMPEMDGFELCRQVNDNPDWKHILLIIYTGTYTSHLDEELGHALGATEYIIKPTEPEALIKLIERLSQTTNNLPPKPLKLKV